MKENGVLLELAQCIPGFFVLQTVLASSGISLPILKLYSPALSLSVCLIIGYIIAYPIYRQFSQLYLTAYSTSILSACL